MAFFSTVLAGVTIFVAGQFVLRLVLDPVVSFKESLGEISAFCLRYRAKIVNLTVTHDQQAELKYLIAKMLSKRQSIPMYYLLSSILNLPKEKSVLLASKLLNSASYAMVGDVSKVNESLKAYTGVINDLEAAGRLLGINFEYG